MLRTGLSIGEDTGVVTLKCIVQNIATQGIEDDLLTREILRSGLQRIEAVIERKGLRFVPATAIGKEKKRLSEESTGMDWVTYRDTSVYIGLQRHGPIEVGAVSPGSNIESDLSRAIGENNRGLRIVIDLQSHPISDRSIVPRERKGNKTPPVFTTRVNREAENCISRLL